MSDKKKNQGPSDDILAMLGSAPSGLGDVKIETTPYLKIIQDLSPEVRKAHPEYEQKKVNGISVGDILLGETKEFLTGDEGVVGFITGSSQCFAAYKKRTEGGGFLGFLPATIVNHPSYKRDGSKESFGRAEVYNTLYFRLLYVPYSEYTARTDAPLEFKEAIVGMKGSDLAAARTLVKMVQSFRFPAPYHVKQAPSYGRPYRFTTKIFRKDQNAWYGWVVSALEGFDMNNAADVDMFKFITDTISKTTVRLPEADPKFNVDLLLTGPGTQTNELPGSNS